MAAREPAEVVVEDPHGAVRQPPRLPGADHDGAHGDNPSGDPTGVTVVICSRDRATQLQQALAAVRGVLREQDELVVVDSASTDAAVAVIAAENGARVLRAPEAGLGIARNVGWRAARRAVVAFTDDDCEPIEGWTQHVEDAFAAPRLGFAFARVVAGAGDSQPLSVTTDEDARTFPIDDVAAVVGHGANMSCRTTALAAIGGFDEALGAGARFPSAEDSDIARRVLRAGWVGAFVAEAVVTHHQWRDRRAALRGMYRYGVGGGARAVEGPRGGE